MNIENNFIFCEKKGKRYHIKICEACGIKRCKVAIKRRKEVRKEKVQKEMKSFEAEGITRNLLLRTEDVTTEG